MLRSMIWQSRTRGAWPPRMNRSPGATHDIMVALDAEMTQIDPQVGHIMEIGVAVVTPDLVPQASLHIVVHTDEAQLKTLSTWSSTHHAVPRLYEGGLSLIELCRESTVTLQRADEEIRTFLDVFHQGEPQRMSLCGNSVWRDLLFVQRYLPRTSELLHHRVIDSSGARELARRHCHVHRLATRPPRPLDAHCAMYDALDAVNFLRWHSHMLGGGATSGEPLALASLPAHAHRRVGFDAIARLAREKALPFPPFIMMPPVNCSPMSHGGPGHQGSAQPPPSMLPPFSSCWPAPPVGADAAAQHGYSHLGDFSMQSRHPRQPTWCRWNSVSLHHHTSHAHVPCLATSSHGVMSPHRSATTHASTHTRAATPASQSHVADEEEEADARSIASRGSRLSWAQRAGMAAPSPSVTGANMEHARPSPDGGAAGTLSTQHARPRSSVDIRCRSRLVRAQGEPCDDVDARTSLETQGGGSGKRKLRASFASTSGSMRNANSMVNDGTYAIPQRKARGGAALGALTADALSASVMGSASARAAAHAPASATQQE